MGEKEKSLSEGESVSQRGGTGVKSRHNSSIQRHKRPGVTLAIEVATAVAAAPPLPAKLLALEGPPGRVLE